MRGAVNVVTQQEKNNPIGEGSLKEIFFCGRTTKGAGVNWSTKNR